MSYRIWESHFNMYVLVTGFERVPVPESAVYFRFTAREIRMWRRLSEVHSLTLNVAMQLASLYTTEGSCTPK